VRLYSITLPSDLVRATSIRFHPRLAEALDQYAELSASRIDLAFRDVLARAMATATDTPATRAWIDTIACLSHPDATQQPVPRSSLVGHLNADGPTADRILELLGWEGLGAACDTSKKVSFELPSAPPNLFPLGVCGAFTGEHWPPSGIWDLSIADGIACLRGPQFAATSEGSDCAWTPNIRIRGTGLDALIPLYNPALMNRDFQEFPMVLSRPYAVAWAPIVKRAAEVISCYSRSAAALTEALVQCVVPLVGGDEIIGSASREEALGLIFLARGDAPIPIPN
jgi:HEXXH motif-containing protein